MSGISSGIGLISGINTGELINQLIALDSAPVRNLQQRSAIIDAQRTAFLALSAKLLNAQNLATPLGQLSFFKRFTSNSSDDSILSATAGETAVPGSYSFRVHSLVTNYAVLSRGFANADETPIGTGTLSFEVGNGQVNKSTDLSLLNSGAGVRRGVFQITDRTGETADIDIATAVTIDDVLAAINSAGINVHARVTGVDYSDGATTATGDRIVIEDTSPADATGNLIIADETGGHAAADLGIAADVAGSRIDGADLVQLSETTLLSLLNDGNGVGTATGGASGDLMFNMGGGYEAFSFSATLSGSLAHDLDKNLAILNSGLGVRGGTIRLTDRSGASVDIALPREGSDAVYTVSDVIDKIRTEADDAGVAISITVVNSHIQITDQSGASGETASPLTVEDLGGHAAADLGIAQAVEGETISGDELYRVETVGDVVRAINYATGNASGQTSSTFVTARISDDGNGLHLTLNGANNSVTITALGDSMAARDLGLLDASFGDGVPPAGSAFETRHLIAGLNTVLLDTLNGGSGVARGEVTFNVTGQPSPTTVDFSAARTLQDIVDIINDTAGLPLVASINATGNGIELRPEDGAEPTAIEIADVGDGTTAADLGIAGVFDVGDLGPEGVIKSGNLQLQYITRNTALTELRGGRGVGLGSFTITDASGASRVIELGAAATTVGHVIDQINILAQGHIDVEARINDTGDGILIADTSGGDGSLSITDVDGHTAQDLRIAGTADSGEAFIDGSYEIRIDVDATDTLDDVVAKINAAGGDFSASVVNDGGSAAPFSLALTSQISGRGGALVIDSGGLDLGFTTMSEAQDAVATFNGALVTSNSNTLNQIIEGVTIDLLAVGDEEVTFTVQQDLDGIIQRVQDFVSAYNDVQSEMTSQTSFNPETFQRGMLFGDSTVDIIRNRLAGLILKKFDVGDESVARLNNVGIRIATGRKLHFDKEKFREVYAESPELVEALFTQEETGFGAVAKDTFEQFTRDFDGLIARKNDLLEDQQTVLNDRVDQLNSLLAGKRSRLEAEFAALELALAGLQDQQASLGRITSLFG